MRAGAALSVAVLLAACTTAGSRPDMELEPIPAFSRGARVLFQGDSITDGNRGRSADPNHILGHGYQFIIAARFGADFPERAVVFLNRGVSGNTVSDLTRRWTDDTIALRPDVVSILVGINDLNGGVGAAEYERQYDALLAETRRVLPNVKLVLGEPFGLPTGPKRAVWGTFRASLVERQAVVARLAAKYHACLVRFQPVFDRALERAPAEYWIWDGIHPTYAGHGLMAEAWVRAVRAFWPSEAAP